MTQVDPNLIIQKMDKAFQQRSGLFNGPGMTAIRLFNGFLEGDPNWLVELFGKTLVINNHAENDDSRIVQVIYEAYLSWIPWIQSVLYKHRYAGQLNDKRGQIIFGSQLADEISESGVRYAVDLMANQDASFYIDTRNLRSWLGKNLVEKTVLNTFAYTGSMGIAALVGGARFVVQTDLNRRFLNVAKRSAQLNRIPENKMKFMVGDFFRTVGNLKKNHQLFDCVILDPPYFSTTPSGRVDLVNENARLVNKVKPLIAHQGYLVVVNNALYVSGTAFLETLEALCKDGYMTIKEIIPVPQEVIGFDETIVSNLPVSPAPFNYSTKIVILQVQRKDLKNATD